MPLADKVSREDGKAPQSTFHCDKANTLSQAPMRKADLNQPAVTLEKKRFFCSHKVVTRGQQPNLVTAATKRTVLMAAPASICDGAGISKPHKPWAAGGQEEPPQLAARGNISAFRLLLGHRTTEDDVPCLSARCAPSSTVKTPWLLVGAAGKG